MGPNEWDEMGVGRAQMNGPNGPGPNKAQMNPLELVQMDPGRAQMDGPGPTAQIINIGENRKT